MDREHDNSIALGLATLLLAFSLLTLAQAVTAGKVSISYFTGSRKAAPVCDKWPDTGWWLSTNSMKRHNRRCENYRKTRGDPCRKDEGSPCGKCGG